MCASVVFPLAEANTTTTTVCKSDFSQARGRMFGKCEVSADMGLFARIERAPRHEVSGTARYSSYNTV